MSERLEERIIEFIRSRGRWATVEDLEDALWEPGMASYAVRDAILHLYAQGRVDIVGAISSFDIPRWVIRRFGTRIPNWKKFRRFKRVWRNVDRNTGKTFLYPVLRGDDAVVLRGG